MKKKLEALLKAKQEQRNALNKSMIESESKEERAALGETLTALEKEIADVREMLDEVDEPAGEGDNGGTGENATGGEGRNFKISDTLNMRNGQKSGGEGENDDPRSSMDYRKAFMDYVRTGNRSEALKIEKRTGDDQTELSDLGGVLIPTTIVNEIIKGTEKVYGQLYSKVKKTNLKGGVKYPIGAFSATFNRIKEVGEGSAPSARQNGGTITGYVEFGYKIGEIRLAQTLLMSVMGVEVFEAELAKIIVEAYVEAMDKEIIHGNPTNDEMCGILNNSADGIQRITAIDSGSHVIEISPNDMLDWKTWQKKLFAKIPLSMRGLKPEFVLTAGTFEANIETLEDQNGAPVARNIYNPVTGEEGATFKGKTVTFVEEDIFPNFDDAEANAYFGMYWVPDKAYAINSNLEFAVRRYFDEEKNQWVDKGLVINDGKILDPKYIFLLKKVANS